jgi:hypothetical protein
MWHNNNLITRNKISIVLLFLLSLRVVPFGLLHYHNNHFANSDALSVIADLPSEEVTLDIENPACSFHQFLTLVNNGFVVEMESEMLEPVVIGTDLIVLPESRVKYLLFKILNKGSPLLA